MGYITAANDGNITYVATENGIVRINFNDLTFRVVVSGNWR